LTETFLSHLFLWIRPTYPLVIAFKLQKQETRSRTSYNTFLNSFLCFRQSIFGTVVMEGMVQF